MKSCCEYRRDLRLYSDGELAPARCDALLLHLQHCSQCSGALEDEQLLSAQIRAAQSEIYASASLRAAVERRILDAQNVSVSNGATWSGSRAIADGSPLDPRQWLYLLIAASFVLMVGIWLTLKSRPQQTNDLTIQHAILFHRQLRQRAVPLDVISTSPNTVSAWFASRVNFPFRLANAGMAADSKARYQLDGGRLVTIGNEHVALIAFHLPEEVVSLVVTPEHLLRASGGNVVISDGISFHSHDQDSTHIVTWNNQGLGYVLMTSTPTRSPHTCSSCHRETSFARNATP